MGQSSNKQTKYLEKVGARKAKFNEFGFQTFLNLDVKLYKCPLINRFPYVSLNNISLEQMKAKKGSTSRFDT